MLFARGSDRFFREIRTHCAINTDTTATKLPTNVHGHSSVSHFLIISARGCMSIAVAFLAVKALRSCTEFPWNLIIHGTAFFASFAARVALAFAFLMLRNNTHHRLNRTIILSQTNTIISFNIFTVSSLIYEWQFHRDSNKWYSFT